MQIMVPILAFLAGGYLALVVRALVAESAARRMARAAETLEPEHLERLRGYIAQVDNAASRQPSGRTLNSV